MVTARARPRLRAQGFLKVSSRHRRNFRSAPCEHATRRPSRGQEPNRPFSKPSILVSQTSDSGRFSLGAPCEPRMPETFLSRPPHADRLSPVPHESDPAFHGRRAGLSGRCDGSGHTGSGHESVRSLLCAVSQPSTEQIRSHRRHTVSPPSAVSPFGEDHPDIRLPSADPSDGSGQAPCPTSKLCRP